MADVVVSTPELTVLGGPREIQVDTNIGPAGRRGSYANYGIVEVASLTDSDLAGGTPQYFDTYTVVDPSSDNYLQVYQYVNISGTDTWNPVVKLKQDDYATNVLATFTAGESNQIKINTADIGYSDIAADADTLVDSRFWYNVQVTLRDDVDAENLFYPAAVTVEVGDVFLDVDDENKLPITIHAAEFNGTTWAAIDSKSLIAQITVKAVRDSETVSSALGGS